MTKFKIITMPDSDQPNEPSQKVYQTPQYLFDYGMCLCDTCGKLHCIDYSFCNNCFREIFIDILPGKKPSAAKIIEKIKELKNK